MMEYKTDGCQLSTCCRGRHVRPLMGPQWDGKDTSKWPVNINTRWSCIPIRYKTLVEVTPFLIGHGSSVFSLCCPFWWIIIYTLINRPMYLSPDRSSFPFLELCLYKWQQWSAHEMIKMQLLETGWDVQLMWCFFWVFFHQVVPITGQPSLVPPTPRATWCGNMAACRATESNR